MSGVGGLIGVSFEAYNDAWVAISEADYSRLRKAVPTLPEEKTAWKIGGTVHPVDFEALHLIGELGLKIEVRPYENCMLVKLQDMVRRLELRVDSELARAMTIGAAVQVHVPDLALMRIDEVTYLDNACTDSLQGLLDEGWRILAVCPPNAQRRPDYILGRRKETVP